jgi:hypothetical protein
MTVPSAEVAAAVGSTTPLNFTTRVPGENPVPKMKTGFGSLCDPSSGEKEEMLAPETWGPHTNESQQVTYKMTLLEALMFLPL